MRIRESRNTQSPRLPFYHLPELVRVRSPLEAHVLVDHLFLTERSTQVRSILPQWYLGSDHLEAPVQLLTGERRSALHP